MDRLQDALGFCEQTFLLAPEQAAALLPLLGERLRPSGPEKRTLCDLYYDTNTWAFSRAAFEGRAYQERLWLRSDEALRQQGRGQVFLRQTLNGRVWQKHIEAGLPELARRMEGDEPSGQDTLFWQELFWFLHRNRPAPKALVRYVRAEYIGHGIGREGSVLKVILDKQLRWQKEDLSAAALEAGLPGGLPLLKGDQAVLAVRTEGALPCWLSSALSGLSVYPARFSKLAACWMQCVRPSCPNTNTKEDAAC